MPSTYTVSVPEDKAGARLDKVLADALPDLSRSRIQALLADGKVTRDGKALTTGSLKVKTGETYQLIVPPPEPAEPVPQAMDLEILFEDEHLIVLNKPPGLVVHPAPGSPDQTLVNALLAHCGDNLAGIGGVKRPGIVHRLDKDTSGLMVVAKSDAAHAGLAAQFAEHSLERAYIAVVWGVPMPTEGEIEGAIGRHPKNRKKMAVVARGGKQALTRYKVLRTFGTLASLVECRLATGRTHQIRVHMTEKGHPLLGDPVYGRSRPHKGVPAQVQAAVESLNRQALHAYLIGFIHPTTGKMIRFESDIPNDIKELIAKLECV